MMRLVLPSCVIVLLALPVGTQNTTSHSGTRVIETGQPFDAFIKKLTKAIGANKMGIVGNACATCGAIFENTVRQATG
jgi:hypothetical protein